LGKDGLLRHCVLQAKVSTILKGCHADVCGGHFVGHPTNRKVLLARYRWPNQFKDLFHWVKYYQTCQRVGKPQKFSSMPLVPILV